MFPVVQADPKGRSPESFRNLVRSRVGFVGSYIPLKIIRIWAILGIFYEEPNTWLLSGGSKSATGKVFEMEGKERKGKILHYIQHATITILLITPQHPEKRSIRSYKGKGSVTYSVLDIYHTTKSFKPG